MATDLSDPSSPPALDAALDAILSALDRSAALTGFGDAEDLDLIRAALARIGARHGAGPLSPLPGDEPQRLDRLLEIAGPQDTPELLRRVIADLARAARQIERALPLGDQAALRVASHVLIAVAGSVGALDLERRARALNDLAHGSQGGPQVGSPPEPQLGPSSKPQPGAEMRRVAGQVLEGIARLNTCLTRRSAGAMARVGGAAA